MAPGAATQTTGDDVGELAQRVDALLLSNLDDYAKIAALRNQLADILKNAHFDLSRARRDVGIAYISPDNIPDAVEPALKVSIDEDGHLALLRTGDTSQPLRWFAALPPSSLRAAQRSFTRAIEIAVETASILSQLAMRSDEFQAADQELRMQKAPQKSAENPTA